MRLLRLFQRLDSRLASRETKDVCLFIIPLLKLNLLISNIYFLKKFLRFLFLEFKNYHTFKIF